MSTKIETLTLADGTQLVVAEASEQVQRLVRAYEVATDQRNDAIERTMVAEAALQALSVALAAATAPNSDAPVGDGDAPVDSDTNTQPA